MAKWMQVLNPGCLLLIPNEKNISAFFLRNKVVEYVVILQIRVKKDYVLWMKTAKRGFK